MVVHEKLINECICQGNMVVFTYMNLTQTIIYLFMEWEHLSSLLQALNVEESMNKLTPFFLKMYL